MLKILRFPYPQLHSWTVAAILLSLAMHVGMLTLLGASTARVLGVSLSWMNGIFLALCCFRWFQSVPMLGAAIFGTTCLWYLPILASTGSYLAIAYPLFWIGFAWVILDAQRRLGGEEPGDERVSMGIAGLTWALAVAAHHSSIFLILGALAWTLKYARVPARGWFYFLFAAAVGAGLAVTSPQFEVVWSARLPTMTLGILPVVVASSFIKPKLSLTWAALAFLFGTGLLLREPSLLLALAPILPAHVLLAVQGMGRNPFAGWDSILVATALLLNFGLMAYSLGFSPLPR